MIACFAEGDAEAMHELFELAISRPLIGVATYDAANNQEPNHDICHLRRPGGIGTYFSIDNHFLQQKLAANREIENSTNTNRTEKPHEKGLRDLLDLMNVPVHRKHDW